MSIRINIDNNHIITSSKIRTDQLKRDCRCIFLYFFGFFDRCEQLMMISVGEKQPWATHSVKLASLK
jgi:hypothetical protein